MVIVHTVRNSDEYEKICVRYTFIFIPVLAKHAARQERGIVLRGCKLLEIHA